MPEIIQFDTLTEQRQAAVKPAGDPLAPYVPSASKPWNEHRIAHLYNRIGFGASFQQIKSGLLLSPEELIDQLLDTAAGIGAPVPPYWAFWTSHEYDLNPDPNLIFTHRESLRRQWLSAMLDESIQAKMALFWHNHFVTELSVFECNAYLWEYYSLLHQHAFGNFRQFTIEVGKSGAMLTYLNGNLNIAGNPNENYARELMELFTMGEGNGYTQQDIVEMSKALTGWQARKDVCATPFFDPGLHDDGQKTIFDISDQFGFEAAHDIIFVERGTQVAQFICAKLYRYFLQQDIDTHVVESLAQTFIDNNWELLPVIKRLLKSALFFEDELMNTQIRMPLETLNNLIISNGLKASDVPENWLNSMFFWSSQLGQELFNPPNVSGWKGHHNWINESTLTGRWSYASSLVQLFGNNQNAREKLRALAKELSNNSRDPEMITALLAEFYLRQNLEPIYLQAAVINFKANIPENYFTDGSWNLDWDEAPFQLVNLMNYLVKLPEYQLT